MATPALLDEQMGPATESKLPLTREADAPSALAPAASRPRRPTRSTVRFCLRRSIAAFAAHPPAFGGWQMEIELLLQLFDLLPDFLFAFAEPLLEPTD
jgi:hypothetical protein